MHRSGQRLRRLTEGQDIVADYASLGLTLGRHPLALPPPRLAKLRVITASSAMRQATRLEPSGAP